MPRQRRILGVWHGREGKQRSDLRGKARTNLAAPLVVGWSSHHGRSWRRPRGTDTVAFPTKVLPTNALLDFIALLASLLVTVVLLFNGALPLATILRILHSRGASRRRHTARRETKLARRDRYGCLRRCRRRGWCRLVVILQAARQHGGAAQHYGSTQHCRSDRLPGRGERSHSGGTCGRGCHPQSKQEHPRHAHRARGGSGEVAGGHRAPGKKLKLLVCIAQGEIPDATPAILSTASDPGSDPAHRRHLRPRGVRAVPPSPEIVNHVLEGLGPHCARGSWVGGSAATDRPAPLLCQRGQSHSAKFATLAIPARARVLGWF